MSSIRRLGFALPLALSAGLAGCVSDTFSPTPRPTADFANIGYATWSDDEPSYRLYPGDELDVSIASAPELNKIALVQPDGRVSLPLIDPVMVADLSVVDAQAALSHAYARQLIRPDVHVAVKTAQPLKIFVGGEVDKPGVYDMPGDIDALRAVFQAGGFKTSAKRSQVVIIRRGRDGRAMVRTIDLARGISDPGRADQAPLRRFDIVYVPRTGVSEAGQFVQQYFRDLLPVQIGFSYALNGSTVY